MSCRQVAAVTAWGGGPAGATIRSVPLISIIIPTYNRSGLLRSNLDNMVAQRLPADEFEVIVADDGSTDDTRAVVESYADRLRLKYTFQEDLGFRAGQARNGGARLAQAPVLAFLDTGTLVGRDWAAAHLEAHARMPDGAGRAVAGYVHAYPMMNDDAIARLDGFTDALAQLTPEQVVARYQDEPLFRDCRHQEFERAGYDLSRRSVPYDMFWSTNCSVGAAEFWAVGGFDEDFRRWGYEDIELGFRLAWHGVSFQVSRQAWAIEVPHHRDTAHNIGGLLGNLRIMLDKHQYRDPVLEMVWLLMITHTVGISALETTTRSVAEWTEACRGTDAERELELAFASIPPGRRVAVFGAGPVVPTAALDAILADFDPAVVARLRAAGGREVLNNLGVRTALPDGAVDVVVITSRLTGVWEQFGAWILAEARRIGTDVRHPFADTASQLIY